MLCFLYDCGFCSFDCTFHLFAELVYIVTYFISMLSGSMKYACGIEIDYERFLALMSTLLAQW